MRAPNFVWGDIPGDSFVSSVSCCYDEVVHWQKHLFRVPSGKCGRAFVSELCCLFNAYATGSALESVAMKAVMIMPILLLQRPHYHSKSRDHISHLSRRLGLWHKGDMDSLIAEGRVLQGNLNSFRRTKGQNSSKESIARCFSNLITCGKVKDALRILSMDDQGGPLPVNSAVMDSLLLKHPRKRDPSPSTLIGDSSDVHPPHPILLMPFVFAVLPFALMGLLVLLVLMLLLGVVCVHPFTGCQMTCVMLYQLLLGGCVLHLLIPLACLLLFAAI